MTFLRICLLALIAGLSCEAGKPDHPVYDYREGDILFYSGGGVQAEAVKEATGSPYTHCGVLFQHEGKWWVFEAVQPIRSTPLEQFMARKITHYRAMRLKNPLNRNAAIEVREWVQQQVDKDYDVKFLWGDQKLYCSELVWKLYAQAGVELCEKRTFKDYKLNAPTVKRLIQQRYGSVKNMPLEEPVVAPSDISASGLLIEAPRIAKAHKR